MIGQRKQNLPQVSLMPFNGLDELNFPCSPPQTLLTWWNNSFAAIFSLISEVRMEFILRWKQGNNTEWQDELAGCELISSPSHLCNQLSRQPTYRSEVFWIETVYRAISMLWYGQLISICVDGNICMYECNLPMGIWHFSDKFYFSRLFLSLSDRLPLGSKDQTLRIMFVYSILYLGRGC